MFGKFFFLRPTRDGFLLGFGLPASTFFAASLRPPLSAWGCWAAGHEVPVASGASWLEVPGKLEMWQEHSRFV